MRKAASELALPSSRHGGTGSFSLKLDEILWEYARDGNLAEVRKHVEAGGNMEFQSNDVYTACGIAAKYARHEVVMYLLDRGADPFRGKDGFHAVKWYFERDAPTEFARVLSHTSDPSRAGHILQYLEDDVETMRLFIARWSAKNDVNGTGTDGHTLLLSYCAHGGVHVHALVDAGADVNMQCDGGNTALHYAAKHNKRLMAHNLMQYPSRVDICNEDGHTALEVALWHSEAVPASDHQAWREVLEPDAVVLHPTREHHRRESSDTAALMQQFLTANHRLMDVNRMLAADMADKDAVIAQLSEANHELSLSLSELVKRVRQLEKELARVRVDAETCHACAREKDACVCEPGEASAARS